MNKDKIKEESVKWSKRVAFFAVFGFTGLAVLGTKKAYEHYRGK